MHSLWPCLDVMFILHFFNTGVTHRHLSDHLSELVENTLNDLEHSKVCRASSQLREA